MSFAPPDSVALDRPASRPALAARVALAAAVPFLAFELLLRVAPHLDPVLRSPRGHFYVVSLVALACALLAVAMGNAGLRHRNLHVTAIALAFVSLAGLVSLHGLSTPGFLMPPTPLPGVAEQVGLSLAAGWLALSLLPTSWALCRRVAGHLRALVWAWVLLVGVLVTGSAMDPHWAHGVSPSALPWVAGPTALAYLAVAASYARRDTTSRSPVHAATAYASAWLAVVQWMTVQGTVWRASWWLHHVLEALAVAVVVLAVAREYAQPTPLGWLRGLPADPEALIHAASTETVRALVAATELRDPYTAGHSLRVTRQALRLGRAMGLRPRSLEALARGTLVHDVGKLEVPDTVLNKPGPLTAEERRLVERHPVAGYDLCARLGFLPEELAVVRHHHERWDGTGYPDGLRGEAIPLLARIVAVVDVYDALTSDRAYRPAWSPERARAHIRQNAGTQFDPQVVAAWAHLVESDLVLGDAPYTGGVNRPSTAVQPPSTTSTEPVT